MLTAGRCCCTGGGGPCILSCASAEITGVTKCPDIELEDTTHVSGLWYTAGGDANGNYDLPAACGENLNSFRKSWCDKITYDLPNGTVTEDGPLLQSGSWINVEANIFGQSLHGLKLIPDPGQIEIGDEFSVTIEGEGSEPDETLTYTATATNNADVTAGLTALINGVAPDSKFAIVEALDFGNPTWIPGAPLGYVLVRPRTRPVPHIIGSTVNHGSFNSQFLSVVGVSIPMFAVEVFATASFHPHDTCGGGCDPACPSESFFRTLPIFHANAYIPCCPDDGDSITLTNGVIAYSPTYFEQADGSDGTLVYAPEVTDGQSLFYECAASYDGGTIPNEYGVGTETPDCASPPPTAVRWGTGGTVTITWHKNIGTGGTEDTDGCPDPVPAYCPPPCITVSIADADLSGASVDCHELAGGGFGAVDVSGDISGEYVISKCGGTCSYNTVECDKVTYDNYSGVSDCTDAHSQVTTGISINVSYVNGYWGVFVGGTISALVSGFAFFSDCEVGSTKPLMFDYLTDSFIGGTVTLTVDDSLTVDDCPDPTCNRTCPGGTDQGTDETSGTGGTDETGGTGGGTDETGGTGGSCSVPCITCNDCAEYCTDEGSTYLTAHFDIEGGECGNCFFDGVSGCLQCCDCPDDSPCRQCWFTNGSFRKPPPPVGRSDDCACFNFGTVESCLGGGHDPVCDPTCITDCLAGGGTAEECGVFSPCSWIKFHGDVNLPLVSHTSTTMTFFDAMFTARGTMEITVVFDCVAKTYHWTIYINAGGVSHRCKMEGTWSGCNCSTCTGAGLPMRDEIIDSDCTGNGVSISSATIHRDDCV
jgi:hypothetical protein